jgi:hypothetical protein
MSQTFPCQKYRKQKTTTKDICTDKDKVKDKNKEKDKDKDKDKEKDKDQDQDQDLAKDTGEDMGARHLQRQARQRKGNKTWDKAQRQEGKKKKTW